MSLDKEKYDYTPYLQSNIMHQTVKTNTVKLPAGITPHKILTPLLDRLSKYHPDWVFISNNGYDENEIYTVSQYYVYKDKEYLGRFTITSRDYSQVIYLDGPRIAAESMRGKGKKTGNVKKAIKLAEEYFRPTTTHEHLRSLQTLTSNVVNAKLADARSKFQTEFRPLSDAVIAYALENWDTTKVALRERGLYVDDAVDFQELYNNNTAIERLAAAKNKAHGNGVWIDNGDYHVINFGTKNQAVYQSDTLPVRMKGKLGMLKLLSVGDVLPDVGARLTQTGFFIVGEEV